MTENRVPTTEPRHTPGCRMPGCEGECTTGSGYSPAEERLLADAAQGAAPRAEGHAFNPSCPCRECHLEAEAEEETWD